MADMEQVVRIVSSTLADEFSDLTDIEQGTRVTLRLLLAALLGGVLGLERERQGKAAGVRTHMLVCLGAALFVLVPDVAGALESARESVRIYDKLGITNEFSQYAGDMVMRLEGIERWAQGGQERKYSKNYF